MPTLVRDTVSRMAGESTLGHLKRRVPMTTTTRSATGQASTVSRPPRLLRLLARRSLTTALGGESAAYAVLLADERYESPPPVARTPAGRSDIQMASWLMALRDALVETGQSPEAATELLAEMMSAVMGRLQRPLDVLAAAVHPKDRFARTQFRETLARRALYRPPDWVMADVEAPGCYGFDVHRCLYADYFGSHGEDEFCQRLFCDQDQQMAERRGQHLLRTGTLAGGADRCDFRYVVSAESTQQQRTGRFAEKRSDRKTLPTVPLTRTAGDTEAKVRAMDLNSQFDAFQRDYPYREIRRDGRAWRYRVGGTEDGPVVLVLAGATMVPDPLFVVISALGRGYRVIAPAYPPTRHMNDLVEGVTAVLDAEDITVAHVVGSSFGGYIAQCLVRAHPDRVDKLVLAQTGVRHFAGPRAMTSLKWMLQLAPPAAVKAFNWRMWQALLVDLGEDEDFWMALLREILDHQLTKKDLVAVMAAMADFTGHHQPVPGDLSVGRPVLVLASEHDRAFAKQAADVRAVYPDATFHTLVGAGHGALFTHTGAYIAHILGFLSDPTDSAVRPDHSVAARPGQ